MIKQLSLPFLVNTIMIQLFHSVRKQLHLQMKKDTILHPLMDSVRSDVQINSILTSNLVNPVPRLIEAIDILIKKLTHFLEHQKDFGLIKALLDLLYDAQSTLKLPL